MKKLKSKMPNTSYLDILFANRNKDYGAYELRKNYNKRLLIPLLILFLCTSISALMADRRKVSAIPKQKRIPVIITPLKPIEIPKKTEPKKVHEAVKPMPKTASAKPKTSIAKAPTSKPTSFKITNAKNVKPLDTSKYVANTNPTPDTKPNTGDALPSKPSNDGTPSGGGATPTGNDATASSTTSTKKDADKKFTTAGVDQEPIFPGGTKALDKFLNDNLIYPAYSIDNDREGKVLLEFVVNELGKITEVKIIDKAYPEMNTEAIRVVNKMPNWKPAMFDGEAVKCLFRIPITFTLDTQ